MLEFIPEKIDRVVVMNVVQNSKPALNSLAATVSAAEEFAGADYVVAVHNWLIGTQLRYVLFDFQDEKEVQADFVEELMQLMKRVRIPFLFTGVMQRPKSVLMSYNYTTKYPIFANVEEAIAYIDAKFPNFMSLPHDGINFGAPIEMVRSRLNGKAGEDEGDLDSTAEDE